MRLAINTFVSNQAVGLFRAVDPSVSLLHDNNSVSPLNLQAGLPLTYLVLAYPPVTAKSNMYYSFLFRNLKFPFKIQDYVCVHNSHTSRLRVLTLLFQTSAIFFLIVTKIRTYAWNRADAELACLERVSRSTLVLYQAVRWFPFYLRCRASRTAK
jgi:hypothetical protein